MTKKNVLINIFVFVAFLISGAVNASRGIEHVRVVWHEDPAHEAYVMWTSDKLRLKSYLYFDTVSRSGDLSKYKNKQRAKVRIIRTTLDWVHKVKLTGLTPDTNYFFVAKTKDGRVENSILGLLRPMVKVLSYYLVETRARTDQCAKI